MAEIVVLQQNSAYETHFWYADTEDGDEATPQPVRLLHQLTPYGMMLASLGSCTAIVMHTYAEAHEIALDQVELRLTYDRQYQDDCANCEDETPFDEAISQEIIVKGDLSAGERKRLLRAAELCPIHKILHEGIAVGMRMRDAGATFTTTESDAHHHHASHNHADHE